MKKYVSLFVAALLAVALFVGCAAPAAPAEPTPAPAETAAAPSEAPAEAPAETPAPIVIKIGATPLPHAEILKIAKELLEAQGYDLQIVEFTDYVQPNLALDSGDLDANFFQHKPYLDQFNTERGTDLISVANVHFEPLGIYAGKTASLDAIPDKAQVAVPNDATNEARALLLLEAQGLIKLKAGADLNATAKDIVENPKNLQIVEIAAEQLARSLQDVDIAVINGNYAIQAGLNAATDALAKEDPASIAATTFANIIVVKNGNENDPAIQALIKAVTSPEVKTYIETTYQGAVVPVF